MRETDKRKSIGKWLWWAIIAVLCGVTLALDFMEIRILKEEFRNSALLKIIQQLSGSALAILLMRYLNIRLFEKPQNLLYLLPCLVIAVDNFQWSSFIAGNMQLVRTELVDVLLFTGKCLAVGLFEELIFRGVLFSVIAGFFTNDKKGFWKTYVVSSAIFAISHLFNGFSFGTILQVGYTFLTGGLFAFCLLKTKNILCCALVHGIYNFCGTFYATQGLGAGVVFDIGTVITMAVVSVVIGVFVLYKVWKYSDEEREELYRRLGVRQSDKNNAE